MKIVIQIPCFNEAQTLGLVFAGLPKQLDGVTTIETQVIDDASSDGTADVAHALGATRVIRIPPPNRRWLGRAFRVGVDAALEAGADILVNTDGDNQYPSEQICRLVAPIVNREADVVIGDRNPTTLSESSANKQRLQQAGNSLVTLLTGVASRDAVSGFRAYSREALLQLPVLTNYTYTVDTLIQAHAKGLRVVWVPITVNPKTRESRLIRSLPEKALRSGWNAVRLFTVFEPFRAFFCAALCFFLPAVFFLGRFLYVYCFVPERASGHVQSVVAGVALLIISALLIVFGMIGELLAVNRTLLESVLTKVRRMEAAQGMQKEEKR